jgi:hypothetical protein
MTVGLALLTIHKPYLRQWKKNVGTDGLVRSTVASACRPVHASTHKLNSTFHLNHSIPFHLNHSIPFHLNHSIPFHLIHSIPFHLNHHSGLDACSCPLKLPLDLMQ